MAKLIAMYRTPAGNAASGRRCFARHVPVANEVPA